MSDVAANETRDLISSDKVAGTSVYDRNGNNLGTISNVMLDKRSGQVAYAVLSFGGFLGIGEEFRALPWSLLIYNEELDAYELNLTDDQLRGAPVSGRDFYERGAADPDWERRLHDYYRATPYW